MGPACESQFENPVSTAFCPSALTTLPCRHYLRFTQKSWKVTEEEKQEGRLEDRDTLEDREHREPGKGSRYTDIAPSILAPERKPDRRAKQRNPGQ